MLMVRYYKCRRHGGHDPAETRAARRTPHSHNATMHEGRKPKVKINDVHAARKSAKNVSCL